MTWKIYTGDCADTMRILVDDNSIQTCITSPPYFGLRDYGVAGQIGLEETPEQYVAKLVEVFRDVRRVLRDDGTLWLNLGDSYNAAGRTGHGTRQGFKQGTNRASAEKADNCRPSVDNLKPKDLIGIPWRVAFALQADGWYLRQDIIWHKPNPMPESVRDRCTKAHEYLFLLSKSERYYFDAAAIAEPLAESSIKRLSQPTLDQQAGSDRVPGKTNGNMKAVCKGGLNGKTDLDSVHDGERLLLCGESVGPAIKNLTRGPRFGGTKYGDDDREESRTKSGNEWTGSATGKRNKRSVWTVTTKPFKGAHFATFPVDLIEPCVLAGSRPGDLVLDPFGGAGTTALAALKHGRGAVLCELNPEYVAIAKARLAAAGGSNA